MKDRQQFTTKNLWVIFDVVTVVTDGLKARIQEDRHFTTENN